MVGGRAIANLNRTDRPDAVVLGIDIGTSGSKGVACLADGSIIARAQRRHRVDRPASGLVEHDAETVWWGDTVEICRELLEGIGAGDRIQALAITTCGPCVVPVDDAGFPLRPGILYGVDTRATAEIAEMEARIGRASIRRLTGMSLTSQSVGPKLAWVDGHEPAIAARIVTWHTATSFIVERLTGVAAIDHHQASYFGPFVDARRREWDFRFAGGLDLAERLPERRWPGEVAGPLSQAAARETGLPAGVPVLVGTSDGPMEALAAGAIEPGIVAIAHGTTTALTTFAHPARKPIGLWVTDGWGPDQPCVGGAVTTTGALLGWASAMLAYDLAPDDAREVLTQEAAASPIGANGIMVVPSFAGETTPLDDPTARGVVAGLALHHDRGDIYRAVLEGIGFGIRRLLEAFEAAGLATDRLRATGGGTADPLALQIVSDITGCTQEVGIEPAGAALGAARLAALAVGLTAASDSWFRLDRDIAPDTGAGDRYDAIYPVFGELARATRPAVHALATLPGTDTASHEQ